MTIVQRVSMLISKIEHLEHLFNFYFIGQEKKPPLTELNSLKKLVDLLMKESQDSINISERFVAMQLINRFTTYRIKWEKGVREIEEGRAKQGQHFFGGLGLGRSPMDDLKKAVSDIDKQDVKAFRANAIINETVDKYIEMNKKYTGKNFSRESVSEMLEKKIDEVRKKFGDRVTFKVYFEDGKVKIKPEKE